MMRDWFKQTSNLKHLVFNYLTDKNMWPFKDVKSSTSRPLETVKPLCPYCGYDLKIMPQRKKKCPSCMQPIYFKDTPDNRTKRLMTEKQAQEAAAQWNAHTIRQSSISTLSLFGYGERELDEERARGAKNDNEAVFCILNRITASKEKDLYKFKMAFLVLASLAPALGKPFRPFKLAAHHCELLHYKATNSVVKKVEIATSNQKNICVECQANKGKIYDIDDALKLMPLPCPKCTCVGFCECYYFPVPNNYD
jgi:hypothetical protein